MKTFSLIAIVTFITFASHSQPTPALRPPQMMMPQQFSPPPPSSAAPAKDPVNYLIRVEWKGGKDDPKFLEVLTGEGQFQLDTIQKNSVKINDSDIPVTLKFTGTLSAINDDKGRLQLFLGRTVPYVTGTSGPSGYSSYSQMSVGLESSFIVTFGKPVVIQNDENGEISVLVKRMAD